MAGLLPMDSDVGRGVSKRLSATDAHAVRHWESGRWRLCLAWSFVTREALLLTAAS